MAETTLKTLIERFRSRPEWQHADPAVRAEAVLRLPSSDHELVLALAREDADARVRRAAVKTAVGARRCWARSRARTPTPACARRRGRGWSTLAAPRARRGRRAARAAVAGLREARQLAAASRRRAAARGRPRGGARRALADPRSLAGVVREAADPRTRLLALGRIEDGATLLALAQNLEQKVSPWRPSIGCPTPTRSRRSPQGPRGGRGAAGPRAPGDRRAGSGRASPTAALPRRRRTTRPSAGPTRRPAPPSSARPAAARGRSRSARPRRRPRRSEGEGDPGRDRASPGRKAALAPLSGTEATSLERPLDAAFAAAERRPGHGWPLPDARSSPRSSRRRSGSPPPTSGPREPRFGPRRANGARPGGREFPDLRARFDAVRCPRCARAPRPSAPSWRAKEPARAPEHLLRARGPGRGAGGEGRPRLAARHRPRAARDQGRAFDTPASCPSRRERDAVLSRLEAARASSTRCCSSCARTPSGSAGPT